MDKLKVGFAILIYIFLLSVIGMAFFSLYVESVSRNQCISKGYVFVDRHCLDVKVIEL